MLSVAELLAKGRVPSGTVPAHNQVGYPDGWPIIPDLAAQVKYDWNYLPADRVKVLKQDPAYRTALENMLAPQAAASAAQDGGASEIPGGAAPSAVAGASPEDAIINAGNEPVVAASEEPIVPAAEPPVVAPAPIAEDEPGTRFDIEYGYVLKTTEGWEVHIQVGESGENVFKARTQKELIAALAKANAHATAKIRAQEIEREQAIADAEPDIEQPRKRLSPRQLTAEEQFEVSEAIASGDPTRINKALTKRDEILFGGTAAEVASQLAETREQQDIANYTAVAKTFMRQNPDVVFSKELGDKLDNVLAENGWAYTVRNLNKVLAQLKNVGEVELKTSTPPVVDPVIPVPTGVAAEVPAAPKPPVTPAVPAPPANATNKPAAGAPPKAEARLRPGSAATGVSPRNASVRAGAIISDVPKVALTADEYNRMSVSDTRRKYQTDRGFREAVDKLIAEGKI